MSDLTGFSFGDFLTWEITSRDTIDFKKVYVDMAGDLVAGLLLSQIVYWYLPTKEGNVKLRVKKEGYYWIAKGRDDWWDEIRISNRQFDRAAKILVDQGLIDKKLFRFAGAPQIHVRLIIEQFLSVFTQSVKSNLPNGENHFTQYVKTLTENTTEITTNPLGRTAPAGFTSKYHNTKLHQMFGGFLRYRKEGDPDFKDPRLYHPALRLWRGVFRSDLTPAGDWRDRVIREVSDHPNNLKVWRKSLETWAGTSNNPNAPLRVLSIYKNGGTLNQLEDFERQQEKEQGGDTTLVDPLSTAATRKRMEDWAALKESGLLDHQEGA